MYIWITHGPWDGVIYFSQDSYLIRLLNTLLTVLVSGYHTITHQSEDQKPYIPLNSMEFQTITFVVSDNPKYVQ